MLGDTVTVWRLSNSSFQRVTHNYTNIVHQQGVIRVADTALLCHPSAQTLGSRRLNFNQVAA
ncbi:MULTISPECIES: hypothetical protein [Wolbachia]|uniref:hypothetical protein n=1 Tax=Wolbachia endosymbiont (group A) of Nomada ferruginata TaxID=3066204 RepID=UPI00217556A5|nr:hypothetical protein [Wolbachia pipientis]